MPAPPAPAPTASRRALRGVLALGVLAATCAAQGCMAGAAIGKPGDGYRSAHHLEAPEGRDRCRHLRGESRSTCETMREIAEIFVRRLSPGDEVCLEGESLADTSSRRCSTRAFVEDVGPGSFKLEVRQAARSSRYVRMDDYWFPEALLVDLYLRAEGF